MKPLFFLINSHFSSIFLSFFLFHFVSRPIFFFFSLSACHLYFLPFVFVFYLCKMTAKPLLPVVGNVGSCNFQLKWRLRRIAWTGGQLDPIKIRESTSSSNYTHFLFASLTTVKCQRTCDWTQRIPLPTEKKITTMKERKKDERAYTMYAQGSSS